MKGTRNLAGFPNTIGTDAWFMNMGNSNYNALDLTLKHTSGPLTLLMSYTYGKSLDDTSNLQEQVNPFNYHAESGSPPSTSSTISFLAITTNCRLTSCSVPRTA